MRYVSKQFVALTNVNTLGCPYLVTASSKENGSDYLARQVFPTSIIVKPPRLDVHDLRFFLKPRVSMGMVSLVL